MDRRRFLMSSLAGALAAPLGAGARQAKLSPRLYCLAYSVSQIGEVAAVFVEALQNVGYVEGRDLTIDYLSANGKHEGFAALASTCVRHKADIIVTLTTPAAVAAMNATSTIPIVAWSSDPVAPGIVASLRRLDRNITAVKDTGPGVSAKSFELLKQAVPRVSRATVVADNTDPVAVQQIKEMENAARSLGVRLKIRDVATSEDLWRAFSAASNEGDEAVITTRQSLFLARRTQIVDLAEGHRLPTISQSLSFAHAGGLMAHGPRPGPLWQRVAHQVAKILQGVKPVDLPVQQPARFDLVINLKTAKGPRPHDPSVAAGAGGSGHRIDGPPVISG